MNDTLASPARVVASSSSSSDSSSEDDVILREDEVDPFQEAVAQLKEKEKRAEAEREAASTHKKKKKSSKKRSRDREAASTPASKKGRSQRRPEDSHDQSVVLEKEVRGSKKSKKKSSANPANSAPRSKTTLEDRTEDGGAASSSSSDSETSKSSEGEAEKEPEPEVRKKSLKKKKKKSSKRSDSDSDSRTAKKILAGIVSGLSKKKRKKKSKKRSRSSSSSSSSDSEEDETTVLTEKTWKLRDNGDDILDMDIRHLLRTPTSSPDVWWRPPFKSRVSRPIRGAGMNMESVLGYARIHDTTIKRCHDRQSLITTKMLLSRNADVSIKDAKILKLGEDKVSYDRKWSGAEQVWEIAEAVSNLVSIIHFVRGYSFEALSIQRAIHDSGWLLGVVESEKEQLDLLEALLDKLLARNSQRARTNLPPMTHVQVREAIKTFLHSKGKSEAGLYGVDPYSGKRRITEEARMSENVEAKVLARLKNSGWVKPGGTEEKKLKKKKEKASKVDGASKVAALCRDFNSQEGCSNPAGDCSKGKHRCAKRLVQAPSGAGFPLD